MPLRLPSLDAIDQELCLRSLRHFVQVFWRNVETAEFVPGWHIDAICEHLEACSTGQIRRLIINIPPRHAKSLTVSVFWPAWDWYAMDCARKSLFSSYAESLSIRDSVKCRRIVDTERYIRWMRDRAHDITLTPEQQKLYKDWTLTSDQNTKIRYDNNAGGYRLATSVGGALTGEGGDHIGVDDPHNVIQGESATVREGVITWWDEAMSTRLNNAKTGVYVIIMQRIHEKDLTGHCLSKNNKEWTHLCLPARYEGKNRVISPVLKYEDPRTKLDEPLWPVRMDEPQLRELEAAMGAYAAAGQLQQNPSPRKGGQFEPENIKIIKGFDGKTWRAAGKIERSVRYWDKAGTEGGGKRTAGVLMHRINEASMPGTRYVVEDIVKGQWSSSKREAIIEMTAKMDGHHVEIWTEQEPGSGGKESAENTIRRLAGFNVKADPVGASDGNKERRAEPYSSQVSIAGVAMVEADWNREYIEELRMFPRGTFKDQVDASSGAFNKLSLHGKRAGTW
jgi:predicted phage terminase large subunit-like protein